jgi:aspartyl-tRNA(Asn)/glutamyl-tRNA(Gln) amidotransferase subunit B
MLRLWPLRHVGLARPRRCIVRLRDQHYLSRNHISSPPIRRPFNTDVRAERRDERVPLRKQLKDEAKSLKTQKRQKGRKDEIPNHDGWELTVGIEIHAQLNTEAKLFSSTRQ